MRKNDNVPQRQNRENLGLGALGHGNTLTNSDLMLGTAFEAECLSERWRRTGPTSTFEPVSACGPEIVAALRVYLEGLGPAFDNFGIDDDFLNRIKGRQLKHRLE